MFAQTATSDPPTAKEKEAFVESVFSGIVPRYDLLNAVLSLGMHKAWRRLAVAEVELAAGGTALDVCCGTGDLALEMARSVGQRGLVVGVDLSRPMIAEAVTKADGKVRFAAAAADRLPFGDCVFDCAAVAFGLRNVPDVNGALREMSRVVRPGGRVVSLEIFGVKSGCLALPWRLYFHYFAPVVAVLLGGRRQAYEYLSGSVAGFMSIEELASEFERCGLLNVSVRRLALGTVCVHAGVKPE